MEEELDMNSLEEKLSRLNSQYQDVTWKCNKKYDELVSEYRKNQPRGDESFDGASREGLLLALSVGYYAFFGTCAISCVTNCDDWWNFDDLMEPWFVLHVIVPTVIIMGIAYLLSLIISLNSTKEYKRVEKLINELERERKQEVDKLQKEYDADKQQIIIKHNQNRETYLKQLRNSNNTLKLKEQVFSDFERVYRIIDKSTHIKKIIFGFCIIINQEDIRISAIQGQSRLYDIGYIYERMQMKNLESIQICEALAVVLSEEVDFMIKEHHKQAITDIKYNGTVIQFVYVEPNMNYKGLEAW